MSFNIGDEAIFVDCHYPNSIVDGPNLGMINLYYQMFLDKKCKIISFPNHSGNLVNIEFLDGNKACVFFWRLKKIGNDYANGF